MLPPSSESFAGPSLVLEPTEAPQHPSLDPVMLETLTDYNIEGHVQNAFAKKFLSCGTENRNATEKRERGTNSGAVA